MGCLGVVVLSLSADVIVELFEKDARARRRLAELLVSEPDVRLAIINAVLRDVATRGDVERLRGEIERVRGGLEGVRGEMATRSDLEKLRGEMATKNDLEKLRSDLERLRGDVARLGERVSRLEGVMSQLVERIGDLDKRIDSLDKRIDYVARVSWLLTGAVIATLIANIIIQTLG